MRNEINPKDGGSNPPQATIPLSSLSWKNSWILYF